jgi:hypothetical protein
MEKKGVEMSLNVIIIAAIGLLILVILAFLVVNKIGLFNKAETTSCSLNGGICRTDCTMDKVLTPKSGLVFDCKSGYSCCSLT